MSDTRSHEHEVTIDAPIDAVWKALTDSAEIVRWFVEDAKIDAREGGKYWVSWGPGMDGHALIEVYDEPRYLKLALQPPEPPETPGEGGAAAEACAMPEMKAPIIEEYTLSSDGQTTTLRLVNSQIPATPEWDQFYDGTNVGWDGYFLTLKHVLERHPGKQRRSVQLYAPLAASPDELWARLTGPEGFCAEGSFDDLKEGDAFSVTTATGDALNGTVTKLAPGHALGLKVASLDDAMFALHLMPGNPEAGGGGMLAIELMTWGLPAEQVDALRERWQPWLQQLCGVPAPQGS